MKLNGEIEIFEKKKIFVVRMLVLNQNDMLYAKFELTHSFES